MFEVCYTTFVGVIKMIKRVVVAGCRDYNNYEEASEYIDYCLADIVNDNEIIILSGRASGADRLGEMYAREKGYKIEYYPADWETYGRSAGPIRNEQMARVCDMVICCWDGKSRGTKSMISYTNKYNRDLKIKEIH